MATDFIQQLTTASDDEERAAILLEMSLSALSPELRTAVQAAAIPHWFDALFLEALLEAESDDLYASLLRLSFVEQVPGRGYAIHERTRRQVLAALWRDEPERFRTLSGRAADCCAAQTVETSAWQPEEIYHRLLSDPEVGIAGLRGLATKWANYEYHTYEEIEWAVRLANEQIEAGRLTGTGADWTHLWQAKLALLYGRSDLAADPLTHINLTADSDPALAAEVAQTEGDALAKTGNREGMAAAWRRAYDLYQQVDGGQLDAYLVAEKLRQEGVPLPPTATEAVAIAATPPNRDALRLIDNIRAAWIEGVLEKALDEKIDLRMTRDSGQPANLVYHRPMNVDRPLAAGQRLSGLLTAAGGSLLILGAPGSGKTITLLQLLAELLQQARQDGNAPIPLLFNLSSFANFARDKEADLTDWLAEQAYNQYRLKRQTTREKLGNGRFVLLLDGLDEVAADEGRREQCVRAINSFMQAAPCGLVVCSRIGDYQALQTALQVAQALVLQPLGNRQIQAFIKQVDSPQQTAMEGAIKTDWQLREALRSPLLLNLYPQAFAAMPAVAAPTDGVNETVEARRQALFAAYVETVFEQDAPEARFAQSFGTAQDKPSRLGQSKYPQEKSMGWLRFLAKGMQKVGTSLFYVEELQPTWLPERLMRQYRGLYGVFIGLMIGVVFALSSVIDKGLMNVVVSGLRIGLVVGVGTLVIWITKNIPQLKLRILVAFLLMLGVDLLVGSGDSFFVLLVGCGGGIATWLTTDIYRSKLRALIGGLVIWLFGGLIGGVLSRLSVWLNNGLVLGQEIGIEQGLEFGVRLGLVGGLMLGLGVHISAGGLSSWVSGIQLRERVKLLWPSKQGFLYNTKWSSFYALIGGGVASLIIVWFARSLETALRISLLFMLLIGLSGILNAFLDIPPVDKRPNPGEGVRTSLRNALRMTLLGALLWGLPALVIDKAMGWGRANNTNGFVYFILINTLPVIFTWFGGLAWCQHWALRFMLWRRGWLPWRLVPWLEEMAARGLLRRVGGGYIFIHRSLLEYFAALGD